MRQCDYFQSITSLSFQQLSCFDVIFLSANLANFPLSSPQFRRELPQQLPAARTQHCPDLTSGETSATAPRHDTVSILSLKTQHPQFFLPRQPPKSLRSAMLVPAPGTNLQSKRAFSNVLQVPQLTHHKLHTC